MRNGDFLSIHINVFNDTGALDNLLYRSITGSIHIAMLMCFSMGPAENMTEKAPNKTVS